MVSTRSSARKPPNPSRPSSATSAATLVLDDPPPLYPRRSPRIRIKNGDNSSLQTISPTTSTPVLATKHDKHDDVHDDDVPEEVSAVDAKRHVDEHTRVEHVVRLSVRKAAKKRRRRRRNKETTMHPQQSTILHQDTNHLNDTHSHEFIPERLSTDAIVAAQSAVQDFTSRELAAKEAARLKKQVHHLGNLKKPRQVGDVEVALTNTFLPVHSVSAKGRKSAASFLAACLRKGPKRVPGSKIATIAASTKSLQP